MNENIYEEGQTCPECKEGLLDYPKVQNCSCHINSPCWNCVDNKLTCNSCGWEEPEIDRSIPSYRMICPGIMEQVYKRPLKEFANGRIFDYDYDSRSGSTMVWRGRYIGKVTAEEILNYFGKGTFGHRGPFIYENGKFEYTKITD